MSFDAIRWALAQPLQKSPAKFLLVALADCVNEKSEDWLCWPSVAHLADTTAQDRKTVLTGMKYLQDAGYIQDTGEKAGRTKQIPVFRLKTPNSGPVEADVKESQISHNLPADLSRNDTDNSTEIGTVKEAQKRNSTENGAVPDFPSNSTVFPMKESQISHETVPKTGHGTSKEPVMESVKEPIHKRARASQTFDAASITLPDWLPSETWQMWVRNRKQAKRPITEDGAKLQLRNLGKYREEGQDPVDVIENAIANGWQGLFPLRKANDGAKALAPATKQSGFDAAYYEGAENW